MDYNRLFGITGNQRVGSITMSTERLHFIGVGGVGMSGIAHVAHDQGMVVTGSDIKESRYT